MAKRKYKDRNGFLHLEGTPISRVQVAPYLGRQIDARCGTPDALDVNPPLRAKEIYYVYRGPDALFNEKTMRSFDGMPFRVGHQMLGKENASSAMKGVVKGVDSNPVDGCFFNVRNGADEGRDGYLLADIVIYTERALNAIANGTKELSLGYRCTYSPVDDYPNPEYHNGIPYQFVQENIVANHLALVPHGRAGSSVCVEDEAVTTEDGLIITCDSLPEEIKIMEENEKKAKDQLVGLLNGSETDIQNCLDYCDLTDEQKEMVKKLSKGGEKKDDEAVATDACPCKSHSCGTDEEPPVAPPMKTEEEKKDEEKKDEEKKAAAAAPAPAPAPAVPAAPAPEAAPEKGEEPAQDALPVQMTDPSKKDEKKDEKKDVPPAQPAVAPAAPAAPAPEAAPEAAPAAPAEQKPEGVEAQATDCKGKKLAKTYTQDELDEACRKAKEEGLKEGRIDGARAHALAEAVGEDAADYEGATEADVARKACKKIKGLEFASDAADPVAIAAIRGHLSSKAKKPVDGETEEEQPKKSPKKTLLSVPTQDEAIARSHVSFNSGKFTQYLATK